MNPFAFLVPAFLAGLAAIAIPTSIIATFGLIWFQGFTLNSMTMLALTLAFWVIHQPRRVGVGVSFFFGLLMDVHQGSILGQHALAYTLLAFVAIALHRRLLWFPVFQQAAQVLPLFIAAHLVSLVVRMLAGDLFPGWSYFIAPCFEAVLWPVVSFIFLAPQRRAPDPDENRPL